MDDHADPLHGDLLADVEFADNPEPRCAVALVLDTSGSMNGRAIAELNAGLQRLAAALRADALASLRVEIAVVTFGGAVRVLDPAGGPSAPVDPADAFTTVDRFQAPTLIADGETPMGEAVGRALALLRARKERYRAHGIDYFRPWLLLLTDGRPTDRGWEAAAGEAQAEEARRGVSIYGVGVEGADMRTLARFCAPERPPLKLGGLAFAELFTWLSKSLSAVSQSRPGDQTPLPPVGWAVADTSS
ncbi:MAG: VWA domain-containing protein [Anaerolineae bacterium]